jgi:hypothetical protein
MSEYLAAIFLICAALMAALFVRRCFRQRKVIYKLMQEDRGEKLTREFLESLDEETRKEVEEDILKFRERFEER